MKFEPVTKVPNKQWGKSSYERIQPLLDDFMRDMTLKCALVKIEAYEYSSSESLAETLGRAILLSGYPIRVCKRGSNVYLEKKG